MRRGAEWLAAALTAAGLEHVEVVRDRPAIRSSMRTGSTRPDAPTVIVYGHYDVQPVDPLDLWTSPPFEPVIEDGRMLARGAADDKGQIHAHLMAAAALLATRGRLPINVRYVFEGEEEIGRPTSMPGSTANRDRLAADVAIISDTGLLRGQPARPSRSACGA